MRPALRSPTVEIATSSIATRVLLERGRARGVEVRREGATHTVRAGTVAVAAGAINSALLLLRSEGQGSRAVANTSGVVGRNYMVHNNTAVMGVQPARRNPVVFQKTLCVDDFYASGTTDHPFPLGHAQLVGKVQADMLARYAARVPRTALRYIADRSVDWWLFSEDIPDPQNRVELGAGLSARVSWRPNNVRAHEVLVRETRRMLRRVGYPIVLTKRMGVEVNSHQAGTVRAGADPTESALDPYCRAHDVDNLWVVDSSFFPSLPPLNPALTIAANALRVAPHLLRQAAER